ncbi:hypothetical protein OG689_14145 [Kitasatospora sp. NBC_00240]|uniref:hypothetical protein n=1 Tax=Kitasatospora sp. NBC_00240 TaxID=2903567 RepID=UPI00224F8480|nr:hypothetical protein [Kitasatospora sp. NBC_00240]MCX5210418.1 hypothetical protein [Kitasatospora sp. NBC_00240]
MTRQAGRRWPRIAAELARATSADDAGTGTGTGMAMGTPTGAGTADLLDAVELMLPAGGPQTLPQVLAPVRAYLLRALGADRPFEGACVFAGEIAAAGRRPVQVRVELLALAPEDGHRVHGPYRRPPLRDVGEVRISPAEA